MATPATYDGLLAHPTGDGDSDGDNRFMTDVYVELFKIRGTTKVQPVGVIALPKPSGCSYVYNFWVGFTHDDYLIVNITGTITNTNAGLLGNNAKGQLHKYKVTDEGDVQLIWRSDETPFLIPDSMGNLPVVSRDGSWAAWCIDSLVDMGTGKVQFQDLYHPSGASDPSVRDFKAKYSYAESPLANCLTRRLLYFGYYPGLSAADNPYDPGNQYGWIYEGVSYSGDVIRSANWKTYPRFYPQNLTYSFSEITRPYQSDLCYVVVGSFTGTSGGRNFRYERFDSDTYLPTDEAPDVYERDLGFRSSLTRLAGGGYDMTTQGSSQFYVPVKPNSTGWLAASRDPTWVAVPSNVNSRGFTLIPTLHDNGLSADYDWYTAPDFTRVLLNKLYLRWWDVEGNIGSYFDAPDVQHAPMQAKFAFRPVLPPTIITGAIDSTRRLFTAV